MNPKVSIIVPVYGVERYIERCAVSLFEQTYSNIEYVFVNDATPDKSIEILQGVIARYPARQKDVQIITHSQNKGLSAARNTGLDNCSGDYIWHVDSDDYIVVNAVEQLVEAAEKHNAEIVIFDINVVTQIGFYTESVGYTNKVDYIRRLLQHIEKCAHWNKFYHKALLDRTGIRSDERIRLAEDYAVTPRLMHEAQRVVMYHEPLYFYETTNQSSYVHNLKRSAVESQYEADKILIDYFSNVSDSALYADIVSVLPQRSMVSLVKNTNKEGWTLIRTVYRDHLDVDVRKMTLVNRVIFKLIKERKFSLLTVFFKFYRFVMRFAK